jgi:hypothetical protein
MKVFNVTETARMCSVAERTVKKWLNAGRLRGYLEPGFNGSWKIPRENLIKFLQEHGMPLGQLVAETSEEVVACSTCGVHIKEAEAKYIGQEGDKPRPYCSTCEAIDEVEAPEVEVVLTAHEARLRPVIATYIDAFKMRDDHNASGILLPQVIMALEMIVRDCYLMVDDEGGDVTDFTAMVMELVNKAKELAPNSSG